MPKKTIETQDLIVDTHVMKNRAATAKGATLDLKDLCLLGDVSVSVVDRRIRNTYRSTSAVLDGLTPSQKQGRVEGCKTAFFWLLKHPLLSQRGFFDEAEFRLSLSGKTKVRLKIHLYPLMWHIYPSLNQVLV